MPSRSLYFFILQGKIAKFAVAKMPDKRLLRHKTGIITHRQNRLQDRNSGQEKGNGQVAIQSPNPSRNRVFRRKRPSDEQRRSLLILNTLL